MLYTPTYDHWSPARWAADAREKRCRIVWDEFCRLVDAREDGRLIPPSEVDSAWRLYLACQRDECTCVNPLDHGEACGFMLELNRKVMYETSQGSNSD